MATDNIEELFAIAVSNAETRRANEITKRSASKILQRYNLSANTKNVGKRGFIH